MPRFRGAGPASVASQQPTGERRGLSVHQDEDSIAAAGCWSRVWGLTSQTSVKRWREHSGNCARFRNSLPSDTPAPARPHFPTLPKQPTTGDHFQRCEPGGVGHSCLNHHSQDVFSLRVMVLPCLNPYLSFPFSVAFSTFYLSLIPLSLCLCLSSFSSCLSVSLPSSITQPSSCPFSPSPPLLSLQSWMWQEKGYTLGTLAA